MREIARRAFLGCACAAALLALVAPAASAVADAVPPEGLRSGGEGRVGAVVDGDTVTLEDGRQVRFVGIQAPKLPLDRPNFRKWPLADEAKAAVEAMARGRGVRLFFGGAEGDRHGRVLAHLVTEDGLWLQGELLERGLARVYTFPDNRALAADLYARERTARAARRGIWGHPYYAVRTAGPELLRDADTFQLVEGTVLRAEPVRGRIYLNFGEDWRSDFTLALAPAAARMFRAAGRDPLALAGQRIRVRGWIRRLNGPLIDVTHPEQIEERP